MPISQMAAHLAVLVFAPLALPAANGAGEGRGASPALADKANEPRLNLPGIGYDRDGAIYRWPEAIFAISTDQQQHLLGSLLPASKFEREARAEFEERRLAASIAMTRFWDGRFMSEEGLALFEPHMKDRDAVIDSIADRFERALWNGAEETLTESQFRAVPLMASAIRRSLILTSCRTHLPEASQDPIPFVLRRVVSANDLSPADAERIAVILEAYNARLNSAASRLLKATTRHTVDYAYIAGRPSRETPEGRTLHTKAWRSLYDAEARVGRLHDKVVSDLCKAIRPDIAQGIARDWDRLKYPEAAKVGDEFVRLIQQALPYASTDEISIALQEGILQLKDIQLQLRAAERAAIISFASSGVKYRHITEETRRTMLDLRRDRYLTASSVLADPETALVANAPAEAKRAIEGISTVVAREAELIDELAREQPQQAMSWPRL